jgi:hypothetical protein
MIGVPLVGALAGATVASFALVVPAGRGFSPGLGVVGLFSVLLLGYCFGSLSPGWALGLGLAPLLAWSAEVPGVVRLRVWLRAACGLLLVAIPLVFVVILAQARFTERSSATSSNPEEPTAADYLNFGK